MSANLKKIVLIRKTNERTRLKKTHLNIKRGIKRHRQISLIVLAEQPQETLLEYARRERVREHDDAIRGIGEGFHLEQAHLIETAGKEIDGVTVSGSTFGQAFVKLQRSLFSLGTKTLRRTKTEPWSPS